MDKWRGNYSILYQDTYTKSVKNIDLKCMINIHIRIFRMKQLYHSFIKRHYLYQSYYWKAHAFMEMKNFKEKK
jgi:hypothetical protein